MAASSEIGEPGLSAYEVALLAGFTGDEAAWLASLQGPPGQDGRDGRDGRPGADGRDGQPGADGRDGRPGLQGLTGPQGAPGRDARKVLPVRFDPIRDPQTGALLRLVPVYDRSGATDGKELAGLRPRRDERGLIEWIDVVFKP